MVARMLVEHQPVPMEMVAIGDTYAESGKPAELLQRYGLTAKDIGQADRAVVRRKSQAVIGS